MPVVAFRVASRTELGGPIKGSKWQYKVYYYYFGEKYQRFERESCRRGQELQKKSIISEQVAPRTELGGAISALPKHHQRVRAAFKS